MSISDDIIKKYREGGYKSVDTGSVSIADKIINRYREEHPTEKQKVIKKSQEEAQRYANESGTGALIGNTLKGIRPWTREGLSNIGQGIVNVGKAIVNPIDTAKKVGGVVKDLATSSAQDTAYDLFYQKGLDKQNLQTIQDNNKKVLELNEAIKATQNESEKEKLKRHAKIYLEFNQRLADETGGELKDKTNLQLAGRALGTAMDLTPFLGFGSLGAKVGLKTLGAAGVKSATKELAKKTGGKIFGKAFPQTGKELTKEAVIEGGLYGGLSGFGAGIEQKDPTLKSVGISTALGTGLGVVAGGILSKVLSRLGAKAPRLEKKIESGEVTEKEIEDIFNDSGIDGVEEIIKPEPVKLKAGEFAPIAKEIQETTGKKLTAKETLEVKDKIEQGYTKEEIIDEITTPKRTELTSKPVKVESKVSVPKAGKGERTYKILKEEGLTDVQGTPVKIVDGVDTFVHKGNGGWVVSESSSGRYIADSGSVNTKESAIKNARLKIKEAGEEKFKKLISENKLPQPKVETPIQMPKESGKVDEAILSGLKMKPDDQYTVQIGRIEEVIHAKNINEAKKIAYSKHLERLRNGTAIDTGSYLSTSDVKIISKPKTPTEILDLKIKSQEDVLNNVKEKAKSDDFYKKLITPNEQRLTKLKNIREQSKSPSPIQTDPLIQEARKYSSAEEFVKSQGTPVYHGTKKKFDSFDLEKSNIQRIKEFGGVRGVSFTGNKKVAERYANSPSNTFFDDSIIGEIKNKNKYFGDYVESLYKGKDFKIKSEEEFKRLSGGYSLTQANDIAAGIRGTKVDLGGEGVRGFGGVDFNENAANFAKRTFDKLGLTDSIKTRIKTRYIGKSKLKDIGYIEPKGSKSAEEIVTKMSKEAKKDGFDGIIFETEQSIGEAPGRMSQPEFLIFEPNKLKTKQQLIDIWNKANKNATQKTKTLGTPSTQATKTGESITAKKTNKSVSPIIKRLNENLDEAQKLDDKLDTTTHKKQLELVEKELENPKQAYNKVMYGNEQDGALKTSLLGTFLEKAKEKNSISEIGRIGMELARHGRRVGQEVEMIKAMIETNPTNKLIMDAVRTKYNKLKTKYGQVKTGSGEVDVIERRIKERVKKIEGESDVSFKIKDAQSILNSLICK